MKPETGKKYRTTSPGSSNDLVHPPVVLGSLAHHKDGSYPDPAGPVAYLIPVMVEAVRS